MEKTENDIIILSKAFAIRIVNLYQYLCKEKREYIMSKQLFRAGTSIGANVAEGKDAQSKADFLSKMNIALKEARESYYWLDLLYESSNLSDTEYNSIISDCDSLISVLTKIVKNTKISIEEEKIACRNSQHPK